MATQNISWGGGRLYFDTFLAGSMRTSGLEYLGYTPELSLNVAVEKLEHFNLEGKFNVRDTSIIRQVTNSGEFMCEDLKPEQFARWLLSKAEKVGVQSADIASEKVTVKPGTGFRLGASSVNPSGNRGVDTSKPITVKNGAVTYQAGIDYIVIPDAGIVIMRKDGGYQVQAELDVSYSLKDSTRDRIVSGQTQIRGQLLFIQDLAVGDNHTILAPNVTLYPNNAFALKGTEWQRLGFTFDALADPETGLGGIIIDGVPYSI